MLRRDPSLRRDPGRHLVGSRLGSRRTKAGWDTLAQLRTEAEGKVVDKALGLAEGRENLGVDMEVVDRVLGSVPENGRRSLAEEDIGSEEGIDFVGKVAVYNLVQEDIGPVAGRMAPADRTAPGSHLRNSCCSTCCMY